MDCLGFDHLYVDVVGLWCRDFFRVNADTDRPFGVLNAHLGSRMKSFGYGFGQKLRIYPTHSAPMIQGVWGIFPTQLLSQNTNFKSELKNVNKHGILKFTLLLIKLEHKVFQNSMVLTKSHN